MVDLLTKNLSRVSWLKEACLDSGSYQKALRNWDKLSKLMKAHWRSGLVLCLIVWFMAVFPEKERRLLSWKMVKRNLKTHWEPQGFEEYRYFRQSWMAVVGLGFCALKGWPKLNLKIFCVSSSKSDLDSYVINCCSCAYTDVTSTPDEHHKMFNWQAGKVCQIVAV